MKKRTVFRGRFVTVKQWRQPLPDGKTVVFEQAIRPDSVIVLPVDARERLVAIRERRWGSRQWIWNLPSGKVEGASALAAARRELAEEARLAARYWRRVGEEHHTSGTVVWHLFVYVARGLTVVERPRDVGEATRPVVLPLRTAFQMAMAGKFPYGAIAYSIIRLWNERRTWLR